MKALRPLGYVAAELWRRSPLTRFLVRASLAGASGYIAESVRAGTPLALSALAAAAGTALVYAVVGLLTPAEPFVGIGKVERVEVPVPPADPEPAP